MPVKILDLLRKERFIIREAFMYIILVVVSIITIFPLYVQINNIIKENIINNILLSIVRGTDILENEIYIHDNIVQKLTTDSNYQHIKKADEIKTPNEFIMLSDLKTYYYDLCSALLIQDNSFVLFRTNDVMLSRNRIDYDARLFYGELWSFENYTYEQFKELVFRERYSGVFLPSLRYHDGGFNIYSDLVYITTISSYGGVPDSVIINVFNSNNILNLCGLNEIEQIAKIDIKNSSGDSIVLINNIHQNKNTEPDISYRTKTGRLNYDVTIPKSYYSSKIKSIIRTITIYLYVAVFLGIILSVLFTYSKRKRIGELISLFNEKDIGNTNEFEYIKDYIQQIRSSNDEIKQNLLRKLILKLLLVGLDSKEIEFIYINNSIKSNGFQLMIVRNCINSVKNWNEILEGEFVDNDIKPLYSVVLSNKDMAILFADEHINIQKIKQAVNQLNKHYDMDIRCVISSVLNRLTDLTDCYASLIGIVKCLKRESIIVFEETSLNSDDDNIMVSIISNSKNKYLYELVKSGNDVEAERLICEQWQQFEEVKSTNLIPNLFYFQMGILTQVAVDVGFEDNIPRFDINAQLNEVVALITNFSKRICNYIQLNKPSGDHRTLQVLEYIQENYCNSSFYLPDVVEKFALSDRMIRRLIKNMTGQTFSDYIIQLRLNKVEELLKTTNLSVSEIANQSGFDSSNSLYKMFKKYYGVSPTLYRETDN